MSWTLKFWNSNPTPADPLVTWNYGQGSVPSDVPVQQATDITNYINSIASLSPIIAQGLLDNFGQNIRFGYRSGDPGHAVLGPLDEYVLIDLDATKKVYFFNTEGQLVAADVRLSIMHELAHIYFQANDPNGSNPPSDAQMNAADFDFRGPAVDEQNLIAIDANLTDQIRTSYFASMSSELQPELFARFDTSISYSNGQYNRHHSLGD